MSLHLLKNVGIQDYAEKNISVFFILLNFVLFLFILLNVHVDHDYTFFFFSFFFLTMTLLIDITKLK